MSEAGGRHLVLGTAGHIDHGKSSLVRTLTGIDPDRLAEEKRRGITIELGFAPLDLGEGRRVAIVDVPGHERFVRHMVAGATGIDAVLLVVAADQGVQPQTREHLAICALLGIPRGVVALTKCDLVEPELQEVVVLELAELLAESFLATAPIVHVSARTGQGLAELREAIAQLVETQPVRTAEGLPRLPVDRSFVMRGFGTVVTGTLASGRLVEGQEIEVLPSGRRARIRGLEVHGESVSAARAGQRTAVNLQGIDCDEVPRGSTLSAPGALALTRRAWARLELLDTAPQALARGGIVRLHQGTAERWARIRVLGSDADALRAELHLDEPAVLVPGDRFVLRRPRPVDTVGGGVIVDANPPRAREASAEAFSEQALESEAAASLRLARAGEAGRTPERLAAELGWPAAQLSATLEPLAERGEAIAAGGNWFSGETWVEVERRVGDALVDFHRREPLRSGMSREELRGRVARAMPQEAWRELLERLARRQALRLDGERVARADHRVVLAGADRELAERIDARFREAGLDPPALDAVVGPGERAAAARIADLLAAEGRLVKLHDGRWFHGVALEGLRARLREWAKTSRTIDVAAFKELAGVTRKNAIPLLEHLDAERFTRRVGNAREILAR